MKKIFILFLFCFIPCVKAETATSFIIMEPTSNRILYAKNIDEKRSVASISKILTAILVIENVDIKKEVVIGDEINKAYGSAIYIQKGEKLKIEDLLYGLLLRSGNDAALALAYHTFSSVDTFVLKMNELKDKIGMTNSNFNNPSGLDEEKGNISTARDMALLTSYAYQNEIFKKITKTKTYKLTTNKNTYVWKNKHKLIQKYDDIVGGKTGFTKLAKRTLVTIYSKDNLSFVVVSLNDGNDFKDHREMIDAYKDKYKMYEIVKKGVLKEKYYDKKYKLYTKESFTYPLTKEEAKHITLKYKLKKGKEAGFIHVYLYDKKIKEIKLYKKKKKKFLW